jgi:hypothetical protein
MVERRQIFEIDRTTKQTSQTLLRGLKILNSPRAENRTSQFGSWPKKLISQEASSTIDIHPEGENIFKFGQSRYHLSSVVVAGMCGIRGWMLEVARPHLENLSSYQ